MAGVHGNRSRFRHAGLAAREVVVLLLILAAAITIFFPYIFQSQVRARRRMCERRQIELAKALIRCESFRGEFPGYRNAQAIGSDGRPIPTGWVFPVLPYLGFNDAKQLPGPWGETFRTHGPDGDAALRGQTPSVFIADLTCPETPPRDAAQRKGWTSFVANTGQPDATPTEEFPADWPANGVFLDRLAPGATRCTLAYFETHDGAERTLLLSENTDTGLWTDFLEARVGFVWVPNLVDGRPDSGDRVLRMNADRRRGDGSLRVARPASFHGGGVNVAFASGSTQFIMEKIDYLVFVQLMTPDDRGLKIPGSDQPVSPPFRIE